MEKDDHRKQSEKWDAQYKHVYPCEGQVEGEDHLAVELVDRGSVCGVDETG